MDLYGDNIETGVTIIGARPSQESLRRNKAAAVERVKTYDEIEIPETEDGFSCSECMEWYFLKDRDRPTGEGKPCRKCRSETD